MDIAYNESERLIRDAARAFLADAVPIAIVAAAGRSGEFPRALWRSIAEQGWFGAGTPAEHGGAGSTLVEWALVLEEMGRVACPGPVVEQLAAGVYLATIGARERLDGVLSGETVVSIAVQDQPGAPVTAAADRRTLTGAKMLVPYAQGADLLLASADDGARRGYYAVDPRAAGVAIAPLHTVSRDQHGLVTLDRAAAAHLADVDADPRRDLYEIYRLARDAYAVGLIGRMLDMTLEFVKQREQFDQPIGAFQAVQYRCVDIALAFYGAQTQLYQAAWLLQSGRPATRELLICHAQIRTAAGEAVAHAHQSHGAMGFTSEYPLHHFSRRAKAYQHGLGTVAELRERIAQVERDLPFPEADEPMWGGFF
ncbi:MAG: acyl-CoA dehydrogenase family protein [Gammaproteobacteria bacterium]